MLLTVEQIHEIAENLDCGMRCFYHLETGEIESVPDFLDQEWAGADTSAWQETLDKLDENWGYYFEFERMSSSNGFEWLSDFVETIKDQALKDKLRRALSKPKPFRNFKWEIDNSGIYRQKWFDYKNSRLLAFVMSQVERYNKEKPK